MMAQQTTSFDLNYMFTMADGRDGHFCGSALYVLNYKFSVNVVTRFVSFGEILRLSRRCLIACIMWQITADFNCQTTPGSYLHCNHQSGLLFSIKRAKPHHRCAKIDISYQNLCNIFVSHLVCC